MNLPKKPLGPETAYRTLIGHTYTCTACRASTACPTAVQLTRAWREAGHVRSPPTAKIAWLIARY
ncbi:hypothetical protein [Streptomyces sp. NPDC056304]|uniref:hypothetical protein n=1 Tax=Streptomyces sp. NPDC056304 TaxID=3345778 RepID=UPI0035DDF470